MTLTYTVLSPNHDPGVIAGATVAAVLILIAMVIIVTSIPLVKKNRRSNSPKSYVHKYTPSIRCVSSISNYHHN